MSNAPTPVTRAFPLRTPGVQPVGLSNDQIRVSRAEAVQLSMSNHVGQHRRPFSVSRTLATLVSSPPVSNVRMARLAIGVRVLAMPMATYVVLAIALRWPLPGGGQ